MCEPPRKNTVGWRAPHFEMGTAILDLLQKIESQLPSAAYYLDSIHAEVEQDIASLTGKLPSDAALRYAGDQYRTLEDAYQFISCRWLHTSALFSAVRAGRVDVAYKLIALRLASNLEAQILPDCFEDDLGKAEYNTPLFDLVAAVAADARELIQ